MIGIRAEELPAFFYLLHKPLKLVMERAGIAWTEMMCLLGYQGVHVGRPHPQEFPLLERDAAPFTRSLPHEVKMSILSRLLRTSGRCHTDAGMGHTNLPSESSHRVSPLPRVIAHLTSWPQCSHGQASAPVGSRTRVPAFGGLDNAPHSKAWCALSCSSATYSLASPCSSCSQLPHHQCPLQPTKHSERFEFEYFPAIEWVMRGRVLRKTCLRSIHRLNRGFGCPR